MASRLFASTGEITGTGAGVQGHDAIVTACPFC
jgi:hypothetical protein